MNEIKVGIDKINLYIPKNFVDLAKLARHRGIDPDKWTKGIGQNKMSVISSNEDIVSMGINASKNFLTDEDKKEITQIIFATESSFDYSKAAATYLQEYLNLDEFVRSYEVKQACYSATAAIQIACDYVRLRQEKKVLIISSDISKYGAKSSGEVTQGAGSIAILISANPKILEVDKDSVSITLNEYDFWRPERESYPFVDSKFSVELYINVFKKLVNKKLLYNRQEIEELEGILFHLPFSKMGKKALISLENDIKDDKIKILFKKWYRHYEHSKKLSQEIGNLYTGSLYLSLISSIVHDNIDNGSKIGFFSYGSGCVAELFTGKLVDGYKKNIDLEAIFDRIEDRVEVSIEDYDKNYFNEGLEIELRKGDYGYKSKDSKRKYFSF